MQQLIHNIQSEIQCLVRDDRPDTSGFGVSAIFHENNEKWLSAAMTEVVVARDKAGKRYMGRKDFVGKAFFADPVRFAELLNVALYYGKEVIQARNLVKISREYPSPLRKGERHRDILMLDVEQNIYYGLELETEWDYRMPERVMVYDVCEWEAQIQDINKRYEEQEQQQRSYVDRKSCMSKDDFLLPIITVVMYLGIGDWQGRRKMSELFCVSENIRSMLNNNLPEYVFPLIEADHVDADSYQTDLREFFQALQCRRDRHRLRELFLTERFRNLKTDTEWVIAAYLDRKRLMTKMEKEGLVMCQAFDELLEDQKKEGRKEGKREEKILIIRRMLQEGLDQTLVSKVTKCSREELSAAMGK